VAFEQSYGGIDGDSASGAEVCCLLSALTDIPLSQELAMTGAIDQMGHVLAVGGVNEKIEGFYDTCHDLGLTGTQGVIIPKANDGDLMLRDDVVESCARGKFRVLAVETVQQALEILSGIPAGVRNKKGVYPAASVLGIAVRRAREYWEMASGSPQVRGK
jgi:ATP-dependent Lon protease